MVVLAGLLKGGMVRLLCLTIQVLRDLVVEVEEEPVVLTPVEFFTLGLKQGMVLLC